MKKIYFILPIILLSVFSCKKRLENKQKLEPLNIEFVNQKNVSYQEIDTDFLLSYPKSLLLTDSSFIIQDDKGHRFYYHVINRKSGLLDFEFAAKGNAPDEILSTSINPVIDRKNNEIIFFDRDKRSLNYYSITKHSMVSKNVHYEVSLHNLWAHEFFDLGEYYLSLGMNGGFEGNRFAIFNDSLQLVEMFQEYPTLSYDEDKNKELKEMLFNIYFFRISPDMKNAVFASYKMGLIEIFSLESLPKNLNKVKSLLITNPIEGDEIIWGFEDVCATNDFIYLLHNGQTSDENPYYSKSIKVFDWNGNPIIEYKTDVNLRCIAIDENEKTIYAIAFMDGDKGFFLMKIDQLSHM